MATLRWAAGVKEMRSIFQRLEAEGLPRVAQVRCLLFGCAGGGGGGGGGGRVGGLMRPAKPFEGSPPLQPPTTQPPNHPTTQPPNHPTTQPPNHPTTQPPN